MPFFNADIVKCVYVGYPAVLPLAESDTHDRAVRPGIVSDATICLWDISSREALIRGQEIIMSVGEDYVAK